jgi:hypothetical protein
MISMSVRPNGIPLPPREAGIRGEVDKVTGLLKLIIEGPPSV